MNADIIIADEPLLPQVTEVYNQIFRPRLTTEALARRFLGRHNLLMLLALVSEKPVGFWIGFELKPGMFFHWMGGTVPELRRHGIARQMREAQHAWAKEQGYEIIRAESLNNHREFVHFNITSHYDVVGTRWDSQRAAMMVLFEHNLHEPTPPPVQ
ncbi:MAG: GNAT family N-acetyltransferase [Phycisphaerae bacterium]